MSRSGTVIAAESGQTVSGVSRRAVVRLPGSAAPAPEALLEVAERVRRALRMIGLTDVSIKVEATDEASVD